MQETGVRRQESGGRRLVLDGGVKVAKTVEEAEGFAGKILGNILVTHQTGPEGKKVKKVLIEKGSRIGRELYLGATLDRARGRVTFMASAEGGVDIEEVAARHPEKIFKLPVDPMSGVDKSEVMKVALKIGLSDSPSPTPLPRGEGAGGRVTLPDQFVSLITLLYDAYLKSDCSLLEINPLVVTEEGNLIALDAKVNFDDNALFRHPDYEGLRDLDEEDPGEIEARKYDLSYISLDGNIGCMVNGAGLAMATMDIIKLKGGEPANFLDVGGGASPEKVTNAFRIVLLDKHVRAVLVNIFAGINRCDWVAEGIVRAMRELTITLPVVVRLAGTNVEQGRAVLAQSGLRFLTAKTLDDAAAMAVREASGAIAHEHLCK